MKSDPRITKLETELREAKEDVVTALAERDAYGRIWRHFELLCNQAGIWSRYDVSMPKSPRRPWKSVLEEKVNEQHLEIPTNRRSKTKN